MLVNSTNQYTKKKIQIDDYLNNTEMSLRTKNELLNSLRKIMLLKILTICIADCYFFKSLLNC